MNNLKIFVCAHKPIENEIPKGKEYVIMAQNDSIKDDDHDMIYLTDDAFTQKHWRCYGEGCAMRYLWKHPELLPDYVGIAHYRRFFLSLIGKERRIPALVKRRGAIIAQPFIHNGAVIKDNWTMQTVGHFEEDATALRKIVTEMFPSYAKAYEEMLVDDKQYSFNISIMKKEDFLEMCGICFAILDEFDTRMGYTDNDAVYRKIMQRHRRQRIIGGIAWQVRMQGFYLEWLTETFCRYKFGIDKCLKYPVGIPNSNSEYATYSYYR